VPSNLELKAAIPSIAIASAIASRLGAEPRGILHQVDTYFCVPKGKLKLRVIDRSRAELIVYDRPNIRAGRYSAYVVLPVSNPVEIKKILSNLLGVSQVVEKKRTLFTYQNARIHLDVVKGLGSFLEFEVVVEKGKKQAMVLFDKLVDVFGIEKQQMIAGSYADLREKIHLRTPA
jgi:predicted adenylyl cyclase CyaB